MADTAEEEGVSRPVPDPTALTQAAIDRSIRAERDWAIAQLQVLGQRLAGMDEATRVLNETVTRTPTDIEKEVGHLKELTQQQFASVQLQFSERDERQKAVGIKDEMALNAALAAQKEAAAEQNKSNSIAIDKSEKASAETIGKLGDLFRTDLAAVRGQVDDLKAAVGAIQSTKVGAGQAYSGLIALIGVVGAVIAIAIALGLR